MATVRAIQSHSFVQYDGTNSTEVVAYLETLPGIASASASSVTSGSAHFSAYDGGSALVLDFDLNADQWFGWGTGIVEDADFSAQYVRFPIGLP